MVARAARTIPAGLRAPALAVAADLVLEDGTMDRAERTFLAYLARELDVDPQVSNEIIRVMKMKNGA